MAQKKYKVSTFGVEGLSFQVKGNAISLELRTFNRIKINCVASIANNFDTKAVSISHMLQL